MKEKIQLLSRGVFEYENPEIAVSEKEIALEVEAGSHYSGKGAHTFTLYGIVISPPLLTI